MSSSCDEYYDAYHEQTRHAVKEHQCDACKETITKGSTYFSIHIVFEGVETIKRCARCQAIHLHLRTLAPGDMWPDERLDCGEEYTAHWGKEPPPQIAALAFADPNDCSALPLQPCLSNPIPFQTFCRSHYWKVAGLLCEAQRHVLPMPAVRREDTGSPCSTKEEQCRTN